MAIREKFLKECLATKKLIDSSSQTLEMLEGILDLSFVAPELGISHPDLSAFYENVNAYIHKAQQVFFSLTQPSVALSTRLLKDVEDITHKLQKNFMTLHHIAMHVLILCKQKQVQMVLQSYPDDIASTMVSAFHFLQWIGQQQSIDLCGCIERTWNIVDIQNEEMPVHEQLCYFSRLLDALMGQYIGSDVGSSSLNDDIRTLQAKITGDQVQMADFEEHLPPPNPMSSSAHTVAPSKRPRSKDGRKQQQACKKVCSTMIGATVEGELAAAPSV